MAFSTLDNVAYSNTYSRATARLRRVAVNLLFKCKKDEKHFSCKIANFYTADALNDYIDKIDEYQRLGIAEHWIVDYLAIGSREYLGNPKVPSVFVYLSDGEGRDQYTRFQGADRIVSPTFPELSLTVEQILEA